MLLVAGNDNQLTEVAGAFRWKIDELGVLHCTNLCGFPIKIFASGKWANISIVNYILPDEVDMLKSDLIKIADDILDYGLLHVAPEIEIGCCSIIKLLEIAIALQSVKRDKFNINIDSMNTGQLITAIENKMMNVFMENCREGV